jgi:hypothetical protein
MFNRRKIMDTRMKTYEQILEEKAWKFCQAGHKDHEIEIVPTIIGDMYAYKTDLYMGFDGYCSGQDDISRTLKLYGVWEPVESAIIKNILENGDRTKTVIDIGAHTGWYSLMAAKAGYPVFAIEADPNNIEVMKKNAGLNGVSLLIKEMWVDEDTATSKDLLDCELVVIDIEGNDDHAVHFCKDLFEKHRVANAMIEISPCFNDRYPSMVNFIKSCGYRAWYADADKREFDDDYSTPQFNLLFVRSEI